MNTPPKRKRGGPKGPDKERLTTRILPVTREIIDSQGSPGQVIDSWAKQFKKKGTK